jgi:hypothetical protein
LQGAVYHLTSRGNAKQMIFLDEKDFADFLRSLMFGGKKISLQKIQGTVLCIRKITGETPPYL